MSIPWWAKVGAKLALSRLPLGYEVWQRLGLFRHGQMDASGYAVGVFEDHLARTGLVNQLGGKTVLELGPGDSVATAVIAAAYGARSILVDSGRYVRADIAPYLELQRALVQRNLRPPDLTGCTGVGEVLERCRASYLTSGLASLKSLTAESVDLIFSQAVLEHVRKGEFLQTMRECRRILRSGGICSHQIDLRDHLGGALNNLRFSERVWESATFVKSGFYTNRISFERMPSLFSEAGFQVQIIGVRRWPRLPTPRNHLATEFRSVPDEVLCVSGFDVLLT